MPLATPTATAPSPDLDVHDPSSPAYKKARRQHLKTTKNRKSDVDLDWTPLRAAEKRYKARFPPPDLSGVLDLAMLDESRTNEIAESRWHGSTDSVEYREIYLNPGDVDQSRKAYIIPRVPGLILLPAFVSPAQQKQLIQWSLCDQARHPNETNLDVHYDLPDSGIWNAHLLSRSNSEMIMIMPRVSSSAAVEAAGPRKLISNISASPANFQMLNISQKTPPSPSVTAQPTAAAALLYKLRWANIGWSYHWGSKQYDFSKGRGEVGREVKNLCKMAIGCVDWEQIFGLCDDDSERGPDGPDWKMWDETYEPDAGIVNFYQAKDTLMAHVDRSEVCATSPLVSISLGNAAIFLIGGRTRDVEPIPILLRSGDVLIMSGPGCRRAYHGVPRILENALPSHLAADQSDAGWAAYAEYLQSTRINVNVRQVFPKGFHPELLA